MTEADELRVVALVLEGERERVALTTVLEHLAALGLSEAEARHAHERVLAGATQAATGLRVEGPSRADDPWGWRSYQYCLLLYPGARLPEVEERARRARAHSAQSRYGLDDAERARARRIGAVATIAFVLLVIWWAVRRIAALRN